MKTIVTDFDALLSPLEKDCLHVLWPNRTMKVKDIYEQLAPKREVALSSVAVILDRLFERGIVDRKTETGRGGVKYFYFPRQNKRQFEKGVVETTVNKLIAQFGSTAVSYFNERFGK